MWQWDGFAGGEGLLGSELSIMEVAVQLPLHKKGEDHDHLVVCTVGGGTHRVTYQGVEHPRWAVVQFAYSWCL